VSFRRFPGTVCSPVYHLVLRLPFTSTCVYLFAIVILVYSLFTLDYAQDVSALPLP
jgi:hypothetical protein